MLSIEGEDARMDARMLKDDRVRADPARSVFVQGDVSDKVDIRTRVAREPQVAPPTAGGEGGR